MFDLRYHVASLAAVFIALIIGILVGVGIADRGLLDKGTRRLLEDRITVLQNRLDNASQRTAASSPRHERKRSGKSGSRNFRSARSCAALSIG